MFNKLETRLCGKLSFKNVWSEAIPWAHRLLLKTERHDRRTAVSGKLKFCMGQHRRLQTGGCWVAWRPGFNKVWMTREILFRRRPYAPFQGEGSKTFNYVFLSFSLPSQSPSVLWPSYQHILHWKYGLTHSSAQYCLPLFSLISIYGTSTLRF